MRRPSPIPFFWLTVQPRASMAIFIGLLMAGAAWTAIHDVDDLDQVCLLALFFQMFASSTGFRHRARRGHFDPILTTGTSRLACASAHWLLSVAPGFTAWLAIAAFAWRFAPEHLHFFVSGSALIGGLYVSTMCWTITLPFQRYVGGVAWLGTIFTLAAGHQLHTLREAFLMSSGSWNDTLSLTGAALVAPVLLVANPDVAGTFPLAAVLGVCVGLWLTGALFIARLDGTLRDPS